jgi:hypothetical protein
MWEMMLLGQGLCVRSESCMSFVELGRIFGVRQKLCYLASARYVVGVSGGRLRSPVDTLTWSYVAGREPVAHGL